MKILILLTALFGLALPAWAAPGVMLRDEVLLAAADARAASVGRLARNAQVEILARQGGWTQVRAAGRTGWVRILSVRASASAAGAADLAGLVGAGTTRPDSSRVVAVAGLRGLTEQELKLAKFNADELALLERYQTDRAEAERFARVAGLTPRRVDYLPRPARQSSDSATKTSPWATPGY